MSYKHITSNLGASLAAFSGIIVVGLILTIAFYAGAAGAIYLVLKSLGAPV